jgi:hypothetical protein
MSEEKSVVTAQPMTSEAAAPEAEQESGGGPGATKIMIGAIAALVGVLVIGFIVSVIWALANPAAAQGFAIVRDFFIIALALEGMLIGASLVILVLQVARLTNLLQSEIRPILEQTNDTVKTVKGTAEFMSRNVADPVIKAGGFLAWLGSVLREVIGIFRITR